MSYPTEDAAFYSAVDAARLGNIIAAAAGTLYANQTKLTVEPTGGTVAITGALVPVRGLLTVKPGDSVTAGFLYGTQGKLILDGATIAVGSNHVAGLYGQVSAAAAVLTSGHVAGLIVSGQNLPGSANLDMIYCESGGVPINSCLKTIVDANYVFDIEEQNNTGTMVNSTNGVDISGGAKQGWVRIHTKDGARKLQLYAD